MQTPVIKLKAPFPWFGGKSRSASAIWSRLGNVPNYVEPFAGSLAVLLNRPHDPHTETVNDYDCYLSNFWRSLSADPVGVAHHADYPVNEADLHARHKWLLAQSDFRQRMSTDPDYYDLKIAGWWVWGQCAWIGSGWCQEAYYNADGKQQLPHLGNAGMGVHRPSQQLPHLGNAGRGDIYAYFAYLSNRLRRVRVACGDWSRVVGDSVTHKHGLTGIVLDPPYSADRDDNIYGVDSLDIAPAVRQWAIQNGDNPLLRIALCGYDTEHAMPDNWEIIRWKSAGGYGSQGNGTGRDNSSKETIWFSPHCLKPSRVTQSTLFDLA